MKLLRLYLIALIPALALLLSGLVVVTGWLTFEQPWWLLALAVLPVLGWIASRSSAGLPPPTLLTAGGLRAVLVLAVVWGLAEVHVVKRQEVLCTLFVLDHSASIPEPVRSQQLAYLNRSLATKGSDDLAGVIVFGEQASVEVLPSRQLTQVQRLRSRVSENGTDLSSAIRLAMACFPAHSRRKIVLMSDGNDTVGRLLETTRQAAGQGIRIDVLPVHYGLREEVIVREVQVPDRVRVGEPFDLRVRLRSTTQTAGNLTIYRDGQPIAEQPLQLAPGDELIRVPVAIDEAGSHVFTARLEAERDQLATNNEASSHLHVQGKSRTLILAPDRQEVAPLIELCQQELLETEVLPPAAAPRSLERLQQFDTVILANVPATDFTQPQLEALRAAVYELGIGLIMLGGNQSFGMGDYRETPLEEALPVEMEPNQKKVLPSGALILAIDCSGSMSGDKLEQIKPAAWAAVEALSPRDQVGIIAFDDTPRWLVEPVTVGEASDLRQAIDQLAPGGGTNIMAALAEAHARVRELDVAVKHILILSDGQADHQGFSEQMTAVQRDAVTVSSIGIGERSGRQLLEALARYGGGRYYHVRDPSQLPRIFMDEAKVVRRSLIFSEPFQPLRVTESELTRPLRGRQLPLLQAYVATSAKPTATVPLVSPTENQDPILAHWQYGLGRSIAFTSDATTNWGRDWVVWEGFGDFWSQALRWVARQRAETELRVTSQLQGRQGTLAIEALDRQGDFLNYLQLEGRLVAPGQPGRELQIRQVAPGRYEASFTLDKVGMSLLHVVYRDPTTGSQGFATTGLSIPYSPEYLHLATDRQALAELAELTGGQLLSGDAAVDAPFLSDQPPVYTAWPAWSLLAALAVLLFLLDVVVRRVLLDREELAAAWALLRTTRTEQPERPLGQLASRRQRRRQRRASATPQLGPDSMITKPASPVPPPGERTASPPTPGEAPRQPARTSAREQEAGYTGRLMAAKRRARRRQQEED